MLLPVVHTLRNFQEKPFSTSPNPRSVRCFSLHHHFGLAVAESDLNPHAVVQAWLPQAGTQPWQEAFWLSASLSSGQVLRGVSRSPLRGRNTIQRQITFPQLNLLREFPLSQTWIKSHPEKNICPCVLNFRDWLYNIWCDKFKPLKTLKSQESRKK